MMYKGMKRLVYGILLLTAMSVYAIAQTPTPTPVVDDDEPIRVSSRLIIVPVSVTDASGQPVLGLTANDFVLSEEGRAQAIEKVSDADKVPLEIAILFDVSASTDSMFQFEQETAAQFLRDVMRPEDHATIFTIGERPLLIQSRADSARSSVSIKSIVPMNKFTAFYDTVRAAVEHLDKNAPAGTRKVVVVISDGEDTNSDAIRDAIGDGYKKLGKKLDSMSGKELHEYTIKTRDAASVREQSRVVKSLQNADAVFYSVNPAGNSYQLNRMSQFGQANLQKFADQTGGSAFLPKFQPIGLKDSVVNSYNLKKNQEILRLIFRQLANELRAQYLVQYYSEADFEVNRYVNLKVGLKSGANLRVRAREGYFVKPATGS
jgi:VWFA-related protein